MNDLDWLIHAPFQQMTRREFDWIILFNDQITLTVECLWRLIEADHIRFTSDDDGKIFGLPAAVDAGAEVNARLSGATVEAVRLREGTLDLSLTFSTGHVLEVIPVSSGYEAWNIGGKSQLYIAGGGGRLTIFDAHC